MKRTSIILESESAQDLQRTLDEIMSEEQVVEIHYSHSARPGVTSYREISYSALLIVMKEE